MTIREKMKTGHLYKDVGEGLDEERQRCKELTYNYNLTRPSEGEKRRDLLENVVAVGNPCRVLREINDRDREYYFKDRRVFIS